MTRPFTAALALLLSACTVTQTLPPRKDQPGEAAEYYASKRAGTDDIAGAYAAAREHMHRMNRYSTASDAMAGPRFDARAHAGETNGSFDKWSYLGPGNIGGRTRTLVFDPTDANIMYAGGVSGGIFKTLNGGERWEAIGDALANLTVNSLTISPTDPRTLYAGTGEGYFREEVRGTALPLRGNGIFVTHDAGATWSRLASTANEDFHWVNDLYISAHDSSRIYAATRTGVWRSNDAGATWTRIHATTVKGGCLDLAARPGAQGDYLFASCGTFEQATIYRAKNAESSNAWEAVHTEANMGRTTLAIAPSNPNVIYALSASNAPGTATYQAMHAVFRSESSGDSGTWQARVRYSTASTVSMLLLTNPIAASNTTCQNGSIDNFVTMGWYCNTIEVDPVDSNKVWVGGVDLFRSDDGGANWNPASYWWIADVDDTSFVHADQHEIIFHPQYNGTTNKTMFVTNDGGVFRTDDALAQPGLGVAGLCKPESQIKFRSLVNNYGATQFYHGTVFPDGKSFIGGAQDNGTLLGTIDGGAEAWEHVWGGDGTYVAVDPNNPSIVYASSQVGAIVRSTNGGQNFSGFTQGLSDAFLFVTPYTLDPNETSRLWIGGNRMWRRSSGTNWVMASAVLPGKMSAVAVAPKNSDRVVAGTSTGYIVRSDAATTATSTTVWSSTKPRDGFVSSVRFDPNDANVVYATYAGFGGAHLWKSVDGGANWTAITSNLPDIPFHDLAIDPTRAGRLFLATDLGVFVSLDNGATWSVENTGFAAAVTEAITIAKGERGLAVYAFTHGRGAWRAELTIPNPNLTGPRRRSVRQ